MATIIAVPAEAVTPAYQSTTSNDIVFSDCDPKETNHPLCGACEELCITDFVDTDTQFFYKIEMRLDHMKYDTDIQEVGMGVITDYGGQKTLVRHVALKRLEKDQDIKVDFDAFYDFGPNCVTVSSWLPEKTSDISLFLTNSFVFTDGVVKLENGTIMMCDNEGNIKSGNTEDLSNIFLSSEYPLSFNCIEFKPSTRPQNPKEGMVIYNKNSKKLEVYNGEEWEDV